MLACIVHRSRSTIGRRDDLLSFVAKTFRPWNVEQVWLLPPSLLDFVPAEHPAHFVRELVRESLDLSEILDTYSEERGYPPFHPGMMTALLLYAYTQGVFSSRKIAKACQERVDFMAVTGMNKPDFRTVAKFRKRHLEALSGLFVQILRLCREAGLVTLGHVALDGTKVKANASKHKAMSYKRMKEAEPRLAAEVEQWMAEAAREDDDDDQEHGPDARGDELPAWVVNKQKRLEKIRAAKKSLEAEAEAEAERRREDKAKGIKATKRPRHKADGTPSDRSQRNFTDPESRILKASGQYIQGYNGQAAVDSQAQVIVGHMLANEQNDAPLMVPMLDIIKENMGEDPKEMSGDTGYCSEANLQTLEDRGIRGYVATGRVRHEDGRCTNQRGTKPGTRAWDMKLRLARGGWRSRYRLRKQVVEPVFGQIKQAMGFGGFLLRGLKNTACEWGLVCTAHNLRKLIAHRPALAS